MSAEQPEPPTTLLSSSPSSLSPTTSPLIEGLPRKSFTAQYCRKEKASIDELEEYFKQMREDFDSCNPIRWWVSQRGQSPRLFQLTHDILCIPGELFAQWNNSCWSVDSRFCCCCREDILRWTGHNLPSACKSAHRYHLGSHACQEVSPPCLDQTQSLLCVLNVVNI